MANKTKFGKLPTYNYYTRNKLSVIGGIIVLILFILALWLITTYAKTNQLSAIIKTNEKFGVTAENLVPENSELYIIKLQKLNKPEYTKPIIDFIYLDRESQEIISMTSLETIKEQKCISRDLKLKITAFVGKQNTLLDKFKEKQEEIDNLKKIYWDKYIYILEQNTEYKEILNEIKNIPVC